MAKKYPGLYLYFDWLKGLVQLPPEAGMKIIENLYHYAEEGIEPEPLENGAYNIIQEWILESLRRSQKRSDLAKRGGYARAATSLRKEENPGDTEEEADLSDSEFEELLRRNNIIRDFSELQ